MKRYIFISMFTFLQAFVLVVQSKAEDSDTLWTKNFMGSGYVSNALFSPDDKSIYVSTTEKFYELETETGKVIREIPEIRGMARFMEDNKFFFSLDYKKYSYPDFQLVKDYNKSFNLGYINGYDFDKKGERFAVIYGMKDFKYDSTVVIYNNMTDSIIFTFKTKENYKRILFSPDSKYFITGSWDLGSTPEMYDNTFVIRLWDTEKFKELKKIHIDSPDKATINYMKFSPDGNYFAYLNSTHIFLYNTQSWQLLDTFYYEKQPVSIQCFNFSNDSKYIYYSRPGSNIYVYSLVPKNFIKTLPPSKGTQQIEFSNNNILLLALSGYDVYLLKNSITDIMKPINSYPIKITPNPVIDTIFITGFEKQVKNISIFDIKGNLVFTKSNLISAEANFIFDLSFLQTGTYIINIKTIDNEYSAKFIKE